MSVVNSNNFDSLLGGFLQEDLEIRGRIQNFEKRRGPIENNVMYEGLTLLICCNLWGLDTLNIL